MTTTTNGLEVGDIVEFDLQFKMSMGMERYLNDRHGNKWRDYFVVTEITHEGCGLVIRSTTTGEIMARTAGTHLDAAWSDNCLKKADKFIYRLHEIYSNADKI